MAMNWLRGEKCLRCEKQRTKHEFEGIPTCTECELKLKAERESKHKCPVDGSEMKKEVIYNVIIDRCPQCAGVWLDNGELDLVKKGIESGAPDDFGTGFLLGMIID
jgi:hypothetical protein